jgi:hypothetical protein
MNWRFWHAQSSFSRFGRINTPVNFPLHDMDAHVLCDLVPLKPCSSMQTSTYEERRSSNKKADDVEEVMRVLQLITSSYPTRVYPPMKNRRNAYILMKPPIPSHQRHAAKKTDRNEKREMLPSASTSQSSQPPLILMRIPHWQTQPHRPHHPSLQQPPHTTHHGISDPHPPSSPTNHTSP